MLSPRILLRRPVQPLHLYRHLLREASYLPPVCQPFITHRIKLLFRRDRKEREPIASGRIQWGYTRLSRLRAANLGDRNRLFIILLHVFARKGLRRRQLLSTWAGPLGGGGGDVPINSGELAQQLEELDPTQTQDSRTLDGGTLPRRTGEESGPGEFEKMVELAAKAEKPGKATKAEKEASNPQRNPDWLDKWSLEKLNLLLRSQRAQQEQSRSGGGWDFSKIRNQRPETFDSVMNAWGRPIAKKAHRAMLRSYWRGALNKFLPPIPKSEWELLSQLARGDADAIEWDPPARRTVGRPVPLQAKGERQSQSDTRPGSESKPEQESEALLALEAGAATDEIRTWNWTRFAARSAHRVLNRSKPEFQRTLGGDMDVGPYGRRVRVGFDRRALRRLYGKVFAATWYEDKEAGKTTKGRTVWGTLSPVAPLPAASPAQAAIFKGVDANGHSLSGNSPQRVLNRQTN